MEKYFAVNCGISGLMDHVLDIYLTFGKVLCGDH